LAKTTIVVILVIIIVGAIAGYFFYTDYVQGTVTLRITDPPPANTPYENLQHVYVTFTKFEIHEANSASENGWHTIVGSSTKIDLVAAVNSSQTVGSVKLSSGRYDQIRLFASNATIVNKLGISSTVNIPSANQTGIKVVINNGGLQVSATSSTTVQLTLQFDVTNATFTVIKADVV
jgi:hypothetical protein